MIRRADPSELALCHALRRKVFIEEQNVSEAEELDGLDDKAIHLLAFGPDGAALGTARLLQKGETGKIGRVCVLADHRGKGLGAALIQAAIGEFRALPGITRVELGAQCHALGFYEKLGFTAFGAEYLDAGILHQDMALAL